MQVDETLIDILSLKRGAGSIGEQFLIDNYIVPTGAQPDDYGNYILRIGDAPVMWSCHTDTVHIGYKSTHQKLCMTEDGKIISEHSNCLGADNGAGVWMCLEMIKAKKEGLYIFHREEEIGGRGSAYIAKQTPEVVEGIKYAVAFDRRGKTSIITHQGTKSCSDEFAKDLADSLGMGHQPDDTGTFTDTAHYTSLIPECTNISAGFHNEHTKREWLDTEYLYRLRDAMLALDITQIMANRDVSDNAYPPDIQRYYDNRERSSVVTNYSGVELFYTYPVKTYKILEELGVLDTVLGLLEEHRDTY